MLTDLRSVQAIISGMGFVALNIVERHAAPLPHVDFGLHSLAFFLLGSVLIIAGVAEEVVHIVNDD